jgi:hypothetical protein
VKCTVFWDVTPYIMVEVHRRFGETCYHHYPGRRPRQRGSYEISVNIYKTTQHHIPVHSNLQLIACLLLNLTVHYRVHKSQTLETISQSQYIYTVFNVFTAETMNILHATYWFFVWLTLTLKMEAIRSFETSVNISRTTWRHIPEHRTLHIRSQEGKCLNMVSFHPSVFQIWKFCGETSKHF